MNTNYRNFLAYLDTNGIRYENNEGAKLVWFGYNIDIGTIEIVVDFEHEKRIGFFSFLNMNVTEGRMEDALKLVNAFNESLNYGCLIVSQTYQIIYKIMLTTLGTIITDEEWSEHIFRLWSISRDIYPLFGRLIFTNEEPQALFEEFIQSKEKQQAQEDGATPRPQQAPAKEADDVNVTFDGDLHNWYLQN